MLLSIIALTLAAPPAFAFKNVDVIPMDRERILKDQTVLVIDGKIADIGPSATTPVPSNARVIEGKGKFLIPGLADMHVHLFSDELIPKEKGPDELEIMAATGVTTIRLMIGTPEHLKLKARVEKGELWGPHLHVASPQLTGNPRSAQGGGSLVATAEEAANAVRQYFKDGYEFIKLTDGVPPNAYDGALKTAKELGIRVVGHVDPRVGVSHALKSGQHIEHLDAYMEAILRDDAPMKVSVSDRNVYRTENWVTLDYIDDAKLKAIAVETAKSGTYTTPTLTFFRHVIVFDETEAEARARPDFRYFPKARAELLLRAMKRIAELKSTPERRKRYDQVRNRLVLEIHRAGGKIMAGSDTPDAFLLYGFSLHRELQNLVEAGLSPYEALAAATRVPHEFLGTLDKRGTIAKGMDADMVLLASNPLRDIKATERREGVMVGGVWKSEAECRKRLEAIAAEWDKLPAR